MNQVRSAILIVVTFTLVVGSFQNCSDPLSADLAGSSENSSLALATPTPAPLSGTYWPNPATVGMAVNISGIAGKPPYTYVKTTGNGTLNGQVYTAPANPETATITVVDTAGHSYPVVIQVYAITATPTPSPSATPMASPTPSPTVAVHRFVNLKTTLHLFTLNQQDPAAVGLTYEGIGFRVFTQANGQQTAPLYRCRIGTTDGFGGARMFVSRDPSCEGYTNQGQYGYVATSQIAGTVKLYRLRGLYDHIATKDPNEGRATGGYVLEGELGYVPER